MYRRPLVLSVLGLLWIVSLSVSTAATQRRAPSATTKPVVAEIDSAETVVSQLVTQYPNTQHRPPVLLVHGWQGVNFDKTDCDDTDPTDPDYNYVDANWEEVDETLEALGFYVDFVRVKSGSSFTETNCTPVAEENAFYVSDAIDAALADPRANGQQKVIIVAHSMGGLVSRAYMESSLYRDDVAALFTLGTPHVGVPVDALSTWVEILTLGIINLGDYCQAQPIVCQFSDNENDNPSSFTGIETFNALHSVRAPGAYYHMLGGDLDFDHRSITCEPIYLIIGVASDCIVPLTSAMGSGSAYGDLGPLSGPIDRLEVYAAHVDQFADKPDLGGVDFSYSFHNKNLHQGGFFSSDILQYLQANSFTDCVYPSIDTRLAQHVCGTVSTLTAAPKAPPRTLMNRTAPYAAELQPNVAVSHPIWVEGGPAVFTVLNDGQPVDVVLVSPEGRRISAENATAWAPFGTIKQSANGISFIVTDAQAGRWQLEMTADRPTRVLAAATLEQSARLDVTLDHENYVAGQAATVQVALDGDLHDATVTAQWGNGAAATAALADNGVQSMLLAAPERAGYAQLTVTVAGVNRDGIPVELTRHKLVTVSAETHQLTDNSTATQLDNGNLIIEVGIESQAAGFVSIGADLVDAFGNIVAHSTTPMAVERGSNRVPLRFTGVDRADNLSLANVMLVDQRLGGIVVDSTDTLPLPKVHRATLAVADHDNADLLIDDAVHNCTLAAPADSVGYKIGETVGIDCSITLVEENGHNEWLDFYTINAPNAWQASNLSTPPSDVGGWNRPTVAEECASAATGVAYWGLQVPHHTATTGSSLNLIQPCDLGPTNLPLAGSYNGPWNASERADWPLGRESFEAAVPPSGWFTYQTENGQYSDGWELTSSQAYAGSFSAFHNDDETCFFCTGDIESWLVMPNVLVRAGDELVWRQQIRGSESGFSGDYDIWISDGSPSPPNDYSEYANLNTSTKNSWTGWSLNLADYAGKEVHIAFRYYADEDYELYLDDVFVRRPSIKTTTYAFDADFTIDNSYSCPGSDFVGVSSNLNDAISNLSCLAGGDLVDASTNSTTDCNVGYSCPLPEISVEQTISVDGNCSGEPLGAIPTYATDVTVCYTITNLSDHVTVSEHTVNDAVWGINDSFSLTVGPNSSATYATSAPASGTAGDCVTGSSSWTATTPTGHGQPQGASATAIFTSTSYDYAASASGTGCYTDAQLYVSPSQSGTAGSLTVEPNDIVIFDEALGTWSFEFDGSAAGLPSGSNIDAFLFYQNGIVMSFDAPTAVPSIGATIQPQDLVLYKPATNSFVFGFDGSDVGLDATSENIDAIAVASGKLVVSTSGTFDAQGISGADEDVLMFSNPVFGQNTSGNWSLYFDGSDVGLDGAASNDINGLWAKPGGDLYFSTMGNATLNGRALDGADIGWCADAATGSTSSCGSDAGQRWDAAYHGFEAGTIDALLIRPNGSPLHLQLDGLN